MNRKLFVPLSESGINSLIKYLDTYQEIIEQKKTVLLERLAELGMTVASLTYMSQRSLTIGYEPINNGGRYRIYANGEEVCFLEFGTGVDTNETHPFKYEVPFDVEHGSWSIENSQQYVRYGYWYFGGVKFYGTKSRPGMYEASKQIQQNVVKIAKEVFG